jgi:hypothetical protein
MAYLNLVQGKSIYVARDNVEGCYSWLIQNKDYRNLKSEAKMEGLLVTEVANYDRGQVVVVVGVDLHPDRHVYHGLVLTKQNDAISEQKMNRITYFTELLTKFIEEKYNTDVAVESGLVLACSGLDF